MLGGSLALEAGYPYISHRKKHDVCVGRPIHFFGIPLPLPPPKKNKTQRRRTVCQNSLASCVALGSPRSLKKAVAWFPPRFRLLRSCLFLHRAALAVELTKLRLCVENCCDVLQVLESIDCMDLQVGASQTAGQVEAENFLHTDTYPPALEKEFCI